ncbi:helix-turn-helix transcriptional regulator [Hominifimenecus sp. rT4P-3]|uniref:helix-turn-helix transcriptional regulator n=1 Tax=Hominifimenecus sp. rT4P-3 TaxID=3242979 RepID=UPI003DA59318
MVKFLSYFKLKRLRHQVFLIFALLLLLLFACLWIFSYQFYYKNYSQNQLSISELALENSRKNLSDSLTIEKLRLDAFFNSSNTQQLIGMGGSYTNEELMTVAVELSNVLAVSGYFEEAHLRIRGNDMVIEVRNGSSGWNIDRAVWDWSSYPEEGFLVDENARSYLRYDFPGSYPLASLQLYPDLQKMQDDIFSDNSLSLRTFLYTETGVPLLEKLMDYPETENYRLTKITSSDDSRIYRWDQDPSLYVITTDVQDDNWILVSLIAVDDLMPPFLKGLQTLYPYFLCLIGIVLIGFILILRQICMPITSIAKSVYHSPQPEDDQKEKRLPDNEISLIGKGIQVMEDQQRKYSELLERVTPQAESQLLVTLLTDINADVPMIQASLTLMKSKFLGFGQYAVFVLQWKALENDSSAILAEGSARIELSGLANTYWKKDNVRILETGKCELALALYLQNDCSVSEWGRLSNAFLVQLNILVTHKAYQAYAAAGPICQELKDLPDSYRQAKGIVEQDKYYRGQTQEVLEDNSSSVFYYRGRSEELLDSLDSDHMPTADELLKLLREIADTASGEDAARFYRAVTDPIAERMLRLQAKGDELFFQIKARFDQCVCTQEQEALLEPLGEAALDLLKTLSQKEQYRHIQAAKRYIEQEYWNSALSLEQVSSYLGISASYLSTLFRNYSTEGFIDYLNGYRVEQARRLLAQSTYTASEVGFKTGFSSSQNFNRVFKKYSGMTPGQFRSQIKNVQVKEDKF